MLLEAVKVSKRYGKETIIDNVSLGIGEGESLSITGLSGSGKTTMLAILGLLLNPTEGEVLIENIKSSTFTDDYKSSLRNSFFGFVFQNPQLIGSLSVLDNVLVPARFARKGGFRPKAEKILKDLGLGGRLNHLPYQLSVGQKRRVAIARAILLAPRVVLADEPTNDLDYRQASWVSDYLLELPRQGKALLLVTHDHDLAKRADRVKQITDGSITDI
ncbi:MAG: ABC transporter ATP-binding protein [Firmicutes bacterium]|nr:ABC transporter ATP-binding protein [Bacillota bacterium]